MDQNGPGVQVPHEAIVRALTDRYGRAMAALHQEAAQLQAALEQVVAERDEATRQLIEMSGRMNQMAQAQPNPWTEPRAVDVPEPKLVGDHEPEIGFRGPAYDEPI